VTVSAMAGDVDSFQPTRGAHVPKQFTITYDYLCPFARIANETLIEAIRSGHPFEPTFSPFSLHQNSLAPDATPVWDRPVDRHLGSGVLALLWSVAVRDGLPRRFADLHLALFSGRHDAGVDLSDPVVLEEIAASVDVDADEVRALIATGAPMEALRLEQTHMVERHGVFGVPTFIAGDEAVFVRFMERHRIDDLERVIDMITWTNVNEFKRTRVPR